MTNNVKMKKNSMEVSCPHEDECAKDQIKTRENLYVGSPKITESNIAILQRGQLDVCPIAQTINHVRKYQDNIQRARAKNILPETINMGNFLLNIDHHGSLEINRTI